MDQATEYKNKGNQAFKEGKFQESVDHFTKAIELNPNDHVFYSNRSGAYASLQDYENALNDATKCVELKPDWSKGYQRKGLAEFYLQKYEQSIKTYEEGLKIDPNNQQLKENLAKAQEEHQAQDILGGVKGGVGADFQGQMPGGVNNQFVLNLIGKLQQNPKTKEYLKDPGFVQKLQLLGQNPMMFQQLGQQDKRIQEAIEVMISGFDTSKFGKEGEGAEEEMSKEEIERMEKEREEQEKQYQARKKEEEKRQQEEKKRKEEEERKKFEASLDEGDKKKNQGNEYFKNKDFNKALELYQEAIDLKPTELLFYGNKSACYIELGQLDNAQKELDLALKIKEEHSIYEFEKLAKIYARYGSLLAKKNDLAGSIEWFKKSLMENKNKQVEEDLRRIERLKKKQDEENYINPEIAEQENEKGKESFKNGKFPDAVKSYSEAIKRNPKIAKYYFNRGLSYQKLMEFPLAIKDYEVCILQDENYVKAYIKKADCHFIMKEYHKALDFFEKGLKFDPNNVECQQGIQKTQQAIYQGKGTQEEQEERARKAMGDPEIQNILRTPEVNNALKAMQTDPKEAMKIIKDPVLGPKIQKLIEAGILKLG